jgi:2-hydroxychromene-2-carboxylate isomerase
MTKTLEFYFDFGSPNAYLAYKRLPAILERTGAELAYRPMLLGGVFKATGNQSPVAIAAKRPNSRNDLTRFVKRYAVPFAMNPHFPVNTLQLMRGAVAAEAGGYFAPYTETVFRGMWVERKNLGDADVLRQTLRGAGLDVAPFEQAIASDEVKERLKSLTEQAVARGVFGAPTFFVGEEMFFGQDRLDFVEEALCGRSYL